jgi:hypothetical protein
LWSLARRDKYRGFLGTIQSGSPPFEPCDILINRPGL